MAIVCRCPACDAKFKIDDQYAGRKAKCPRCATITQVPAEGALRDSNANAPQLAPQTSVPDQPTPTRNAPAPALAPATDAFPAPDGTPRPTDTLAGLPSASQARRSHASRSKKPAKRHPSNLSLAIIGMAAAAIFVLGGGMWGVLWLMNRSGDSSPATATAVAQLVLDWPSEERGGATVQIDGKKRSLPGAGRVAYALAVGEHQIVLQRRGYEPIQLSVSLAAGDVHRVAPAWRKTAFGGAGSDSAVGAGEPVPIGFEGWTQRYDAALRQAAQQQKDVLVALVGSDWNGPSVRMAREVFPDAELHRRAAESLVLVVIDLPQSQRAYEQVLDSAQNALLREEFNIAAADIPALVMLDAQGKPFAIEENYDADTAQDLLADIDAWRRQREERDRLFSQVAAAPGAAQLPAAVEAVNWLRQHGLTRFYGDRLRPWEALARQHDPTNAAGQYEVLYEANWIVRWLNAGRNEDRALIARLVEEFDRWRRQYAFHDANRAGRMHLVAAASLYQLDRREAAVEQVEAGLRHKPQDPQLLAQLQTLAQAFSGELGSGTGFVVAPGYLLTNYHVIEGPGRVVVMSSGSDEETAARVVARDEDHDIALLQVTGEAATLPPLALAQTQVGRGAPVAAFGYPLGNVLGRGLKLTTGVVSALPEGSDENMYLLDCRINPGNSGGPLCDQHGRVVGMVTAKSGISQDVDSYGMALPADVLQAFLANALPGWTPAAEASSPALGWDEVDRAVSASVVMVVKKQ